MKKISFSTIILIAVMGVFAGGIAHADEIKLKNGDTLSGTILQFHAGEALIQTSYAGDVSVKTEEIIGLKTTKPVYLELSTGPTYVGVLADSPSKKTRVITKNGVKMFYPHDVFLLRALMPDEEQQAKFNQPMVWDHRLELGAQIRTGNSDTQDGQVIYGSRMTAHKVALSNALAASVGWASGTRTTQQVIGESRLDWSHTERFYSFYSFNGQHDLLKNLFLRAREEAGVGYKFIKTSETLLQGDVGVGLLEDVLRYSNDDIDPLGHAGFMFTQKIGKRLEFGLKSVLLPDFSDFKHILSESEAWLITPLSEHLMFKMSALDRFDSKPPLGTKKNDISIRTGIVIVF